MRMVSDPLRYGRPLASLRPTRVRWGVSPVGMHTLVPGGEVLADMEPTTRVVGGQG